MVQNAGQGIAFRLEVVRKRGSCARTWGHGFSRFRRDGQRSRLRGGIRPPPEGSSKPWMVTVRVLLPVPP